MHCWVKDGKIYEILSEEHEPDEMGSIYKMSWFDNNTLSRLRRLAWQAQWELNQYERSLAAKLVKENESS